MKKYLIYIVKCESKDACKNVNKSRKKARNQEVITPEDLKVILGLVDGRCQIQKSRRRLCIILLYMTDLRISFLL